MVVVGAARSGVAAAELLVRRGARVTLTDMKPSIADARAAARRLAWRSSSGTNDAAAVARRRSRRDEPGCADRAAGAGRGARSRGVPVIGELELAFRWLRGRVIAITGTKGKSTTTTLVGRMLSAAGRRVLVGGNIGVPLSAQVDASTEDTVHVVEASSFQLETTDTFHPWIAALLNFSPDHLDRHPSEEAYGRGQGARLREPDAGRLGGRQRRQPGGAGAGRRVARRAGCATPSTHPHDAAIFVERDFIWQRTSEGQTPLVPLASIQLPGATC